MVSGDDSSGVHPDGIDDHLPVVVVVMLVVQMGVMGGNKVARPARTEHFAVGRGGRSGRRVTAELLLIGKRRTAGPIVGRIALLLLAKVVGTAVRTADSAALLLLLLAVVVGRRIDPFLVTHRGDGSARREAAGQASVNSGR